MKTNVTGADVRNVAERQYGVARQSGEASSELQVRRHSLTPALPPARQAQRRRFPWKSFTFTLAVVLPTALAAVYLYSYAADQYVSEFRFRLRHAQPSKLESSSALAGLTGAGAALETMTDSEIVVQYLQSRQVIDDMKPGINLDAIYGKPSSDWWSRLDPDEPIENKVKFWRSVADPFFDASTGVVTVKVRAFEPSDSQQVSAAMLRSAERLVNDLSVRAQEDKLAYSRQSVEEKLAAWKRAETKLREFRNANEVVLPNMQASESSRLDGALRTSESRMRSALQSARLQGMSDDSPQVRSLQAQLTAITAEIKRTQTQQTRSDMPDMQSAGAKPAAQPAAQPVQSFATVLTTYEGLDVDAKISAKAYEMALMAEQRARDEASQQQIYLDAFVKPAIAEKSLYPIRWRVLLQVGFAAFAAWCLGMLLWRGVMDHID